MTKQNEEQKINKTIAENETKLKALRKETIRLEKERRKREREFQAYEKNIFVNLMQPQNIKQKVRNAGAYLLGRRNLKRLYSPSYKRKQASNDLLPYVRSLYEEGFIEKTIEDLTVMFETKSNSYTRRAIAQELALYYANKETKRGANIALYYIGEAKRRETDKKVRQQLAILEAECYVRIGEPTLARQRLHEQLQASQEPDLYLALANTEATLDKRLYWLNKTLEHYGQEPIVLEPEKIANNELTYESLHKARSKARDKNGPKISVILPAYNAADSIHIAIESILNQTWQDIELLIVDDCSTDATFKVIEQYAKKDDRIQVFQTEKNSGPYVARNIALAKATGEFITINDADDWSHQEKLAVQATHLLEHEEVIANTSELARLTNTFHFYRRGTRGNYIFSNMSSLMFRRQPVLKKVGYWDEVRFAADGEYKRRLIQAFGKEAVVDLKTGPLSLPEQSTKSLTASSAFGYSGFFMGARKEYVTSFSAYHERAKNLYYPKQSPTRLFPVPEPMLPESRRHERFLDTVIVANFYDLTKERSDRILKQIRKNKELNIKTGLVQMYDYDTTKRKRHFHQGIRRIIDGEKVQMLVYGEKIKTNIVFIHTAESLLETQRYIPQIKNRVTQVIIDELTKLTYNRHNGVRRMLRQTMTYFSDEIRLYPLDDTIREKLQKDYKRQLGNFQLAAENWLLAGEKEEERYSVRLRNWLVDQHDFI